MQARLRALGLVTSCALFAACGGSVDTPPDPGAPSAPAAPGASSGSGGASSGSGGASSSGSVATGPYVHIHVRGSVAPFTHTDGLSGETPLSETIAIKSLELLRSPADPAPLRVFDLGASPKEVELTGGARVLVAKVSAKTLASGVFTVARVGVSYARYSVGATMHSGITVPVPGQYDNVQVLSDGAPIDGIVRKKGYFRYAFAAGGVTYGTLEGADAPMPVAATSGGIRMESSATDSAYVFPVQLAIDPNVTADVEVDFDVNVTESFRWADDDKAGYVRGVFDTTPSTFEPVMAFGANAFALSVKR